MLLELNIQDFAIIDQLSLTFGEGMTALTGETGAGKSIIIDAVGLLLGARGSSDYLRKGASKCTLEGLFGLPQQAEFYQELAGIGLTLEDDSLVIQREILANGKNICRLNGHLLTISNLKRLGRYLVDIQGQHDHQALLQPERHLYLLDEFGKKDLAYLKKSYQVAYEDYRQLAQKVRQQQKNEKMFAQRMDMLRFQVEEIQNAQLVVGEEEELLEERNKLVNYQKIVENLTGAYQTLAEESPLVDQLGQAMSLMSNIAALDAHFQEIAEGLESAYYATQEAVSTLSSELDSLEWDQERLEWVESRLEVLRQLKRKYGEDIPAVLGYYEEISGELADAEFLGNQEELTRALKEKQQQVFSTGGKLQAAREKVAATLAASLKKELADLYMADTQFEVRFRNLGENFTAEGLFDAEFYIQTNVGEDLKPLVKVASGGELSRLLLGLKSLFAKSLGVTSIIFDEVDSGVSGRVAKSIADKIYKIATNSQVLCITHLPQVAAVSDQQFLIEKVVENKRTKTQVRLLERPERIELLAKMSSGEQVTPLSLQHAEELLDQAHLPKKR